MVMEVFKNAKIETYIDIDYQLLEQKILYMEYMNFLINLI